VEKALPESYYFVCVCVCVCVALTLYVPSCVCVCASLSSFFSPSLSLYPLNTHTYAHVQHTRTYTHTHPRLIVMTPGAVIEWLRGVLNSCWCFVKPRELLAENAPKPGHLPWCFEGVKHTNWHFIAVFVGGDNRPL
jgi:hypothetical protein